MRLRKSGGFTIVELLLALALFGLLLAALNTFIFSMGEIWGRGSSKRLFEQHARAVTHFIDRTLREAAVEQIETGGDRRAVQFRRPTEDSLRPHLLSFEIERPPHLIQFPSTPLPRLRVFLELREREGLFLLWRSDLEVVEEGRPQEPRPTLVSPHLVAIGYDYYDADAERWENTDRPKTGDDGEPQVPDRLRLRFELGEDVVETAVTVPAAPRQGRILF